MSGRATALLLAATAVLVAAAGLSSGPFAAFCAAPVAGWLALCALALRADVAADDPRHLVGVGAATALLGAAFALAGGFGVGLVMAVAGAAIVTAAAQAALRFDPPPLGAAAPTPSVTALTAAVALDEGVKLWWEITRRLQRRVDAQGVAAEVRAAADRNHEQGWIDHPAHSHLRPPPLEKSALHAASVRGLGKVEQLSFASEFEPQDPEIRTAYLAVVANRTARASLWRHAGGQRPTLICLHDYEMGQVASDARRFRVDWLHRDLGLDVATLVLPLHGARSRGRRSGAGFLDGHPLWTNAAVAQAVWDLRRLSGWLRSEGASVVGVLGSGLGGYVAAVASSVENGVACVAAVAPVVALEDLVWRQMSAMRRAELRAAGLTEHLLKTAWARHSPLRMRPVVVHEARLIAGGLADRIVPPAEVAALWEHWGRPVVHWFPGGHVATLDGGRLRTHLRTHLRANLAS